MSLIIAGLPFSGKSTFGRHLSKKLQLPCIDLDDFIGPCRQIFLEEGEEKFREAEQQVLKTLSVKDPSIICLGGGALKDADAVHLVKSLGTVIFLNTNVDTIWNRIELSCSQTLRYPAYLDQKDPKTSFYRLAAKRLPHYLIAADIIL
jgi:shikimate kinase